MKIQFDRATCAKMRAGHIIIFRVTAPCGRLIWIEASSPESVHIADYCWTDLPPAMVTYLDDWLARAEIEIVDDGVIPPPQVRVTRRRASRLNFPPM